MTSIEQTFDAALKHHQAGDLPRAEQMYRDILRVDPYQADALHLLGLLAHQVGNQEGAVDCISRAIVINPQVAAFHNNLGEVHRVLGKLDEALACYLRALQIDPGYADAHGNQSVVWLLNADFRGPKFDDNSCVHAYTNSSR